MQPPPIPSNPASSIQPSHAIALATVAAVGACLALPFAFIPFLGLGGSALALGFIIPVAIWTRRKRAFIGSGVALLSTLVAVISSFICLQAIIESRNDATAKMAHVQSQLEAMKARASTSSERSVLADIIKAMGGNDVTDEQAKLWGGLAEWALRAMSTDNNGNSDPAKN